MDQLLKFMSSPNLLAAFVFAVVAAVLASLVMTVRERVITRAARRASQYQYTSGERASEFFDLDTMVAVPEGAGLAIGWYCDQIGRLRKELPGGIDKLVFIEKDSGPVGAITLAGAIVERTGIPSLIIRPRRRILAASFKAPFRPWALRNDDTLVVVSDVATSGRGIRSAIGHLRELGVPLKIPYALVWIDLNKGAAKALLDEYGVRLLSFKRD